MEDSLTYLNAVSEASQAMNTVTALKEQAQAQYQQGKERIGSEFELGGEIGVGTLGSYLAKKAGGFISEKLGGTVGDLAGKVGISEETVGKALSGDISGALESGTQEVTAFGGDLVAGAQSLIGGTLEGVTTTAQTMAGSLLSQGESVISEATQSATGILGRVSSGLDNLPSLSTISINPESSLNSIYSQGLNDLKAQMGIDDETFRNYTDISLNESRQFSYNNPMGNAGQEIEMTDFAAQPYESTSTIGSVGSEVTQEVSTAAGELGAEAGGATTEAVTSATEAVGTVAAEAVGEVAATTALDFLGPIGALAGLGLGLWSFFHGEHEEAATPPPAPYVAALNPSAQFGATQN